MSNTKAINLYLMDGDLKGRIKCATKNWVGIAYKIPKDKINEAKEMEPLKKLGIYFLFGKNKENKPTIYVGQAIKRANGNGLLGRILEPHKNQNNQNININDWTEAIAFTIKDTDSIDTDDLNYLENKFYNLAKITNRYYVLNNKEPEIGNPNEEKESQLEEFVKYVKLFTEILGHKVFEPINADEIINYQFNESTTSENNVVRDEIPQEAQHSEIPVDDSIKEVTLKNISFSKELKFAYLKIFGKKDDVETARDIYQKLVQKYVKDRIELNNYNKKNPIILDETIKLYSQEYILNKRKNKTDIYKRYKNISEDWYLDVDRIVFELGKRIKQVVSLMGIPEEKIIIGYYQKSVR